MTPTGRGTQAGWPYPFGIIEPDSRATTGNKRVRFDKLRAIIPAREVNYPVAAELPSLPISQNQRAFLQGRMEHLLFSALGPSVRPPRPYRPHHP